MRVDDVYAFSCYVHPRVVPCARLLLAPSSPVRRGVERLLLGALRGAGVEVEAGRVFFAPGPANEVLVGLRPLSSGRAWVARLEWRGRELVVSSITPF